jgi:GH24 family phage-related lysozyme (muramidase)
MNKQPITGATLTIIKDFEGCKLQSYQDSGGKWTIGCGTTGPNIGPNMTITQDEADQMLYNSAKKAGDAINSLVTVELTPKQFDALVSLVYNIGITAFTGSKLLKLMNEGSFRQAAAEFSQWDHVHGQVIASLRYRREKEAILFLS